MRAGRLAGRLRYDSVTDRSQPEAPQPAGTQPDDGASRPQHGSLPQRMPLGESLPQRGGSIFEQPGSSSAYDNPVQPGAPSQAFDRADAAAPSGEVLARLRDALLDSDDTLPGGGNALSQAGASQSPDGWQLPQRGGQPEASSQLPQRGGQPDASSQLPQRGGQPDASSPLPQRGAPFPQRGGQPDGSDALPRRTTRTRPSGRHRSPHRLSVASDAPALVLAVPGWAGADSAEIGPRVASIAELSCPGVDIRVGYIQGADLSLADCVLPDPDSADHNQFPSVIVPLLLGPSPAIDSAVSNVAAQLPVPAVVAGHLGPHPLVAEALHARLAEAGLARHARATGLSISADRRGIIVLADKDEQAASAAAVAAVLLASRLSVPVVPASLGDPASIADAVTRLSDSGVQPALAPCLIGPETSLPVLDDLSAALGAPASATLGAHQAVGQLVAIRYGAALARLSLAG